MGETYMHLANTFKDELTYYLKQYTLCNAIDSSISLLNSHRIHKRGTLCKLQMFLLFENFMWLYTISSFYKRYFNKQ